MTQAKPWRDGSRYCVDHGRSPSKADVALRPPVVLPPPRRLSWDDMLSELTATRVGTRRTRDFYEGSTE